jgi:hypothetical protein
MLSLFEDLSDYPLNILPHDGTVLTMERSFQKKSLILITIIFQSDSMAA